jgi:hypothetical protein
MTDLFKIGNLISGGKAIVTDLYSSIEGTERVETIKTRGEKASYDTGTALRK